MPDDLRTLLPLVLYNTLTANDPTPAVYGALDTAYNFFNSRLYDNRLPPCLITLQRGSKHYYGHYRYGQFITRDGKHVTDEISLNPRYLRERSVEASLATLVHEMTHCEQHHFGKPSRAGHHNKEWGVFLRRAGLIPSSTGEPGGRETGQKMSHDVEVGGVFEQTCAELLAHGFALDWGDAPGVETAKKPPGRLKYTCPSCGNNYQAKPGVHPICGDCRIATGDLVWMKPPD
jgi:hypothetical protein